MMYHDVYRRHNGFDTPFRLYSEGFRLTGHFNHTRYPPLTFENFYNLWTVLVNMGCKEYAV